MTLDESIVYALTGAVEGLLDELQLETHEQRVVFVEAARVIEQIAAPYAQRVKQTAGDPTDGR